MVIELVDYYIGELCVVGDKDRTNEEYPATEMLIVDEPGKPRTDSSGQQRHA